MSMVWNTLAVKAHSFVRYRKRQKPHCQKAKRLLPKRRRGSWWLLKGWASGKRSARTHSARLPPTDLPGDSDDEHSALCRDRWGKARNATPPAPLTSPVCPTMSPHSSPTSHPSGLLVLTCCEVITTCCLWNSGPQIPAKSITVGSRLVIQTSRQINRMKGVASKQHRASKRMDELLGAKGRRKSKHRSSYWAVRPTGSRVGLRDLELMPGGTLLDCSSKFRGHLLIWSCGCI